MLGSAHFDALLGCHAARQRGDSLAREARQALFDQSEELAGLAVDVAELEAAWAAIEATRLGRKARGLLGPTALARTTDKARKRGIASLEPRLRLDPLLPMSFRANPAQHFYALQNALAARRRQQWREACDREPGAFERAA